MLLKEIPCETVEQMYNCSETVIAGSHKEAGQFTVVLDYDEVAQIGERETIAHLTASVADVVSSVIEWNACPSHGTAPAESEEGVEMARWAAFLREQAARLDAAIAPDPCDTASAN